MDPEIPSSFVRSFFGTLTFASLSNAQTAKLALETYDEGPVWQIMTFRTPAGRTEQFLKNIATVWEHQLKQAKADGVIVDYTVLTKWAGSPDDWNVMVIEKFPNMASYDSFWEDWLAVDEQTIYRPDFQERLDGRKSTGTEFLGTLIAREVYLKPQ